MKTYQIVYPKIIDQLVDIVKEAIDELAEKRDEELTIYREVEATRPSMAKYAKYLDNRLLQRISEFRGNINTNFNMSLDQMRAIFAESDNEFQLVSNGFTFGYMQGMRATQAQQKPKKPSQCTRKSKPTENIRAYLDRRGISVAELAEMVYMGRDELESQLNNVHEMPLHVFMFICRVLKESPDAFIISTT